MKFKLFDNEGETLDRYTVVYNDLATNDKVQFNGRGMSEDPSAPQGIGSGCTVHMSNGFMGGGEHLGKEIELSDAPEAVQRLIASDLWGYLGAICTNEDDELEEPFNIFDEGIHREDVWHWFERTFKGFSVAQAMGVG